MKKAIPGITADLTPGRPLNCGMHETVQDGQAYRTRSGYADAYFFFGERCPTDKLPAIPTCDNIKYCIVKTREAVHEHTDDPGNTDGQTCSAAV